MQVLRRVSVVPMCRNNISRRCVSSLSSNPHIKVFPDAAPGGGHILTYLETNPPVSRLAVGSSTQIPPTPRSFSENSEFMPILNQVLQRHAAQDPDLQSQAKALAGTGIGGHVHLSDLRNPPDYGRIAFPEDILGSIEADAEGNIVGEFEPSGTYRIVTNEGILGLSDFLRTKLVEQLKKEELSS
ncbi:hypothetical protein F5Y16DRAFT_243528 [Xylariaceae sp. FL0255]|nr:hypothetical protein F5Y16DRAFT_243528 [Xylariaceae sp. FL0255]